MSHHNLDLAAALFTTLIGAFVAIGMSLLAIWVARKDRGAKTR